MVTESVKNRKLIEDNSIIENINSFFKCNSNLDILHPLPLVDEHGLVAVHEPGEVLEPL